MEAKISNETRSFYGPRESDYNGIGKKGLEWDLNDWRWDGDLFLATPLNAAASDCRNKKHFPVQSTIQVLSNASSSSSDETNSGSNGKGKGDSEKRRRVAVEEDDEPYDNEGSLSLKLGGHIYPITESNLANWDGKNDKKGKVQGGNSSRALCQAEGCRADLSDAKDYHRRHKVCEMHAKASQAIVGNATQRFCQQCSRFHLLQEFDEGKRSCRRRLAGHNKRRRKTLPDNVANWSSLGDDRASGNLLISLLKILSHLHSDRSGQPNDQNLLPHLLKNLATLAGSFDERNVSDLLQASQDMQKTVNSAGPSSNTVDLRPNGIRAQESSRPLCSTTKIDCISENHDSSVRLIEQSMSMSVTAVGMPSKANITETSLVENFEDAPSRRPTNLVPVQDGLAVKSDVLRSLNQVLPVESAPERGESNLEKVRIKNFDLNSTYSDAQDSVGGLEELVTPSNMGTASVGCPSWMLQDSHQLSPPQISGNSDSASAQSLSSSNGDAPSRTRRIVFKLFGKNPSNFPLVLRSQILNWLSNSPTEIESYIRPGCIILTVYLRLTVPRWEELCNNLSSSMKRLLDAAGNDFWRIGWVYVRLHHRMGFIYNGKVVLDAPLPLESHHDCQIVSVTPIAVSISEKVEFKVKGFNIAQSTKRLLCAFEGKYLVEETTEALIDGTDAADEHDGSECLIFSCFVPNSTGRGFIEVEDHSLSSSLFPFIVAEHDVCTEIRSLENTINLNWTDGNLHEGMDGKGRSQTLDFLHEIGWLLRRSYLSSRSENMIYCSDSFSLSRFKWLMEFSMNHDWCAVVKKLLDILYGGSVDAGGHSVEFLLSEMSLLHSAVRRSCRPMVELLLRYVPPKALEKVGSPKAQSGPMKFFFRPDMVGPSNVTPLHIVASIGDAENVLDALTDDPGQVGITAWKRARDDTGFTPQEYARVRGFLSYLQLVQKKDNLNSGAGHVVLNIYGDFTEKKKDGLSSGKMVGLQIEHSKQRAKQQSYCQRCSQQQLAYRYKRSSLLIRPAMLAMVGIAAVCVCVGLLLKGPPEIMRMLQPFNWESLGYGSI